MHNKTYSKSIDSFLDDYNTRTPYGVLSSEWVNNIVYTKEQLYYRPQVEKRVSVSRYMSVHMYLIITLVAAVLGNQAQEHTYM